MRLILDEDKARLEKALDCIATDPGTSEKLIERVLANMRQLERAASTMKPCA